VTERKRILYVEHMAEIGGGQRSVLEIIRRTDRTRFAPVVTCVARGELSEAAESLGAKVEIVDIRRVLRKNPAKTVDNIRALNTLIKTDGIDLVHVNSLKALLMIMIPARLNGIGVIWHCRVTSDYGRFFDYLGCVGSATVLVPSRFLARRFHWCRQCSAKVRLVPNAVDAGVFDPGGVSSRLREELALPADSPVVGALGRLEEEKGFEDLVRAAPVIAKSLPGVRFLIVGGDPGGGRGAAAKLERMIEASGVSSIVSLAGHRKDIPECIAAMDVVVVPSRREVFSRVAVEAMAMEKPVVASSVGGLPEVVADGTTGLLVPPRDPRALAEAVVRVLGDRAGAGEMGRAGRRRVLDLFEMTQHIEAIEIVYSELLRGRGAAERSRG
jgi:glycosyltransferase involved in cell wall biosynthesis